MTLEMREREVREEEREAGIRMLIESLESFSIPKEAIIKQIIQRYQLTREEAEEYVNRG